MEGILSENPDMIGALSLAIPVPSKSRAQAKVLSPEEFRGQEESVPSSTILEALARINSLLLAPGGSQELFPDLAGASAEAFGYPFVAILLFDEGKRRFELVGSAPTARYQVPGAGWAADGEPGNAGWVDAVLAGQVYVTPRPAELMASFAPQAGAGRTTARTLSLKLGIVAPLMARARPVGALMIGSKRAGSEAGERSDLLALAQQVAVAVEMWSLYDRVDGRTAVLRELQALSQTITGILDLDKLYTEVARAAGQLARIDFCTVNTLIEDGQKYKNNASWGQGERAEIVQGARSLDIFPPEMVRRCLMGEPIVVPDVEGFPMVEERLSHRQARSISVFPFKSDGKVAGFITVGRDEPGEWDAADIEVLQQLSDYVTVAFTNARLYADARRHADRMTTLYTTGQQLARIHEWDLLFHELRSAVQRIIDAPVLQICLLDVQSEEIEIVLDLVDGDILGPHKLKGPAKGPAGRAIESRVPYHVAAPGGNPTEQRQGKRKTGQLRPPTQSVLSVPLMSGDRAVGALTAESYEANAYSEDDVQTLQILAAQAAVTLDNIRLLQAEAQHAAEQAALAESAHAIARLDIDTVLQKIVEKAGEIVKSSRANLRLYDEATEELYWAAGYNSSDVLKALRVPVGKGIIGHVFVTGEPALVDDLRTDPRAVFVEANEAEHARASIAVPLRGPNGNIGVLASTHNEPNVFGERDLEMLSTFADYATIALSNAHLYSSLQQREEERSSLLHQTLTSQEAERRRVAMDIHDGPLQSIGVTILGIDRARKLIGQGATEQGVAELLEIREAMSSVVQELRDVINDLRPVVLERQGLVAASEVHLKAFTEQYGIKTHFEDGLGGERLPAPIEVVFYRLMQEALTNVRKHAGARAAWVRLALEDGIIRMSITDNGRGFDPEQAVARSLESGHIGLHSMMERIGVIGGGMELDSTTDHGSRVTFWAPAHYANS